MGRYDEEKAVVFNIVHGSFVDGWGIRTTIFLKGCPLRCLWCCNPEGQQYAPELRVLKSHCNGCGRCVAACPRAAIAVAEGDGESLRVDRNLCDNCLACADVCYFGALEVFGKTYTVNEMFEIIARDEPFYVSSGGGLTIGGGEATCYPKFCLGLIERCHERGIPVAIDTCGQMTQDLSFEVLRQADLLLFDIKGLDPQAHRENTGVSNQAILDTLQQLNQLGKDVIIRVPVIPGHTDSDENLRATAEMLSQLSCVRRVDILPVHEYGKSKYEELGIPYTMRSIQPLDKARQQEVLAIFEAKGLKAQLGG